MASRFVDPTQTKTLTLANGDTLLVKRRLTAGEQRRSFARMYVANKNGEMHSDPLESGIALITAYLLDWSITDDGEPVPIKGKPLDEVYAALDALDYPSFVEIKEAIEAHEKAMTAERNAEKNGTGGEMKSAATSPSPSAVDGASSGSES